MNGYNSDRNRSEGLKAFITLGKAGGKKLIQDRSRERAKM
jgi:hypothetical protein